MGVAGKDGRTGSLTHGAITEKVIAAFFAVYNELGAGFLESVYVNSLVLALADLGLEVEAELPLVVHFRGHVVGVFRADLVVNGSVIVEVKAVERIITAHEVQLVNYLRATGTRVGLLLNFGPRAEFKRRVCTTSKNQPLSASSA